MTRLTRYLSSLLALLVLHLAALLTVSTVHAQAASEKTTRAFGALQWRSLGPARAGRSLAIAGSVARPHEYYFGATGGGLWKTTNGGAVWRPVTDGQIASSSVGAIAVAPSNPDVVYIGTGESELRGDVSPGDGIYKSVDGGKTWVHSGFAQAQTISKIRVHPANPDLVYAAVFGHLAGPNEERGIFRSRDGGRSWQKVLYRDSRSAGIEINFDPGDPNVLYAALWEAFRVSHTLSSGGPGSGLFKSTDGGDQWTEISRNPGLPQGLLGKIGVAVSPVDSNRVYALIEADGGGTFRSDDAGATWKNVSENRDVRQRAFYFMRIYADPADKDTIYAPNAMAMKSTDAGKTWVTMMEVPFGDQHDVWLDPTNPQRSAWANDGGATVTIDGGRSWTSLDMPTAQMYHVATTQDVPYHVCGAQQDQGTACVSSGPPPGFGQPNAVLYYVGGGESGYIANDPLHPDIFYAGSSGGYLSRFDRKTGQARNVSPYPDESTGYAAKDIAERFQWTFPIVFSRVDPTVLYAGSQHLWKTTTGGVTWTRISPDLTRHDPKTMGDSGGPLTRDQTGVETYATIFSIAPSALDGNLIWTGSDDGYIHLTRDGGKSWSNVTPKDMPAFTRISLVEPSACRPGTAYVAANRYQYEDFAPYVWRTDDYGATWARIVSGIGARDYVRVVREDITRAGLLYLGTEHSVYVSFDDGAKWQSLRQNLPDTPVHDLKVEGHDLVIATHGRGFYVMENISPLRQWDARQDELHLFKPEDALRGFDETLSIDYLLKRPAAQVLIEILDASGKVIRKLSATQAEAEKPKPPPTIDDLMDPKDPEPSLAAGLQRFQWDLRYDRAISFPGLRLWAASTRGPIAPPGNYQVRVTVDGHTAVESFAIKRHPRLLAEVTDADLQKQFELAMRVHKKTNEANEAVLLIRGIKPQITERSGKLDKRAGAVAKALRALESRLTSIETQIYQVNLQSIADPINFPIMLNNKIAALQGAVESADAAPTEQSYVMFDLLTARLKTLMDTLDAAVQTDLPAVNRLLQSRGLAPLKPEAADPERPKNDQRRLRRKLHL